MLMDRPRKSLKNKDKYIYPNDTGREYVKAAIIIGSFLLISLISTFGRGWGAKYFWQDFIAIFLIVSAGQKMIRYELFLDIFSSYDILSKKWKPWPYLYPFIELTIGANLLLTNGSKLMYLVVVALCAITGYSVLKQRSKHIRELFACLDNSLRLPLSLVSLFESVILAITAIYLFIVY